MKRKIIEYHYSDYYKHNIHIFAGRLLYAFSLYQYYPKSSILYKRQEQKPLLIKGLSITMPPRGFKWNTIENLVLRWKGVFESVAVVDMIRD